MFYLGVKGVRDAVSKEGCMHIADDHGFYTSSGYKVSPICHGMLEGEHVVKDVGFHDTNRINYKPAD